MKDEWLIYKIVFPNGKHYIGLTKDLKNRIHCHKRDAKNEEPRPVYHAANHFGWGSIKFETIHDHIDTLDQANELEKKYIIEYNSYVDNGQGYNCTLGGDGSEGRKRTPEELEEFRQWSIELWKNPAHREKMSKLAASRKGSYTDESRSQMSESAKRKIQRDGHSWVGRNHKAESREKMKGPRDRNSIGYLTKSIKDGRRIYCSKLDFVFFSLTDCAKFLGSNKSTVGNGMKNPNTKKYKSLSYYN
jgi:group I intron endonuclease